ncbi:Fic family protein [Streptomyces tuirus]|uniref:Fic family protein n=1 Tax=Streptomyces tuirus TaxID=68278 RepID=A0A941J7J3_9ACTN|nr:Fic family protein [Streptomyces tuirus]
MSDLVLPLDPTLRQALGDLADAQGRTPEDVVLPAVPDRRRGHRHCRDRLRQAAALPHAIAANHSIVDGNKRTARPATATFLALNGVDLAGVDQDVAYALVVDVESWGGG